MPGTTDAVRVGSRLGRATMTFVEQVRGQHNTRADGRTLVVPNCAWVPEGPGTETQENRATTEARSTGYVPRGLPDWLPTAVCTVEPGPTDAAGQPLRLAVVGPAQPYWRRRGTFSHSQVTLRESVS